MSAIGTMFEDLDTEIRALTKERDELQAKLSEALTSLEVERELLDGARERIGKLMRETKGKHAAWDNSLVQSVASAFESGFFDKAIRGKK